MTFETESTSASLELKTALSAVRLGLSFCRSVQKKISTDLRETQDNPFVSIADFGCQGLICRLLGEVFPDDPIMTSEDSAALKHPGNAKFLSEIQTEMQVVNVNATSNEILEWIDRGDALDFSNRFWVLAPIDGTIGFLNHELFTVSLALIVDGVVQLGVLGSPQLDVTSKSVLNSNSIYYAEREKGAFVFHCPESESPNRLRVTTRSSINGAKLCESPDIACSAQDDSKKIAKRLELANDVLQVHSQIKYALVASGVSDIFMRLPTKAGYFEYIWDHAVGSVLMEEAGGRISDMEGNPLDFTKGQKMTRNRGAVATNGILHDDVVAAVREIAMPMNSRS